MKFRLLLVICAVALLVNACGGETPTGTPVAAPPTNTTAAAGAAATDMPAGAAATGSTIKVGGGFALTGDESSLDLPAANGAKLAAKEINAAGGALGRPIELVVHDTQYKMDL